MKRLIAYLKSSIGRKKLMGLTGVALYIFIIEHSFANLLILKSAESYNKFSHALISNPFIYVAEFGLVAIFLLHIFLAIQLTRENRRARPKGYAAKMQGDQKAPLASRIAVHTGIVVLVFLIYHLITFKYGAYYEITYDGVVMRDLHRLILEVFAQPGYFAWYMVCLAVLWFHLSHGFASSLQSLGIDKPISRCTYKKLGYIFGSLVVLAFMSQPFYVFFCTER